MFETLEARTSCAILNKLANADIVYNGVICRGVFRRTYAQDVGVSGEILLLEVPQSRFKKVKQNDELMLDGVMYTVDDFEPDHERRGIVTLTLKLAS